MKKINLKQYDVEILSQDGTKKTQKYSIKDSLIVVLYHPTLKLTGRELLKTHLLSEKIENHNEDYLLLEDADYNRLKSAVEQIEGFNKNDVEFVKRVLEAEDVEVKEKK